MKRYKGICDTIKKAWDDWHHRQAATVLKLATSSIVIVPRLGLADNPQYIKKIEEPSRDSFRRQMVGRKTPPGMGGAAFSRAFS